MNHNEWGLKFVKYIIMILDWEKKIEMQRQILGSVKEFEPYAAFMRMDRENKKYITINDMKLFLREMNVRFSERHLREVIRFYDKDRDSCLNYEEFLKLVLTNSDNELRADITQRRNYTVNKSDYLINEIEENLALLIVKEMELVKEMLFKVDSLKYYNCVDYHNIFKSIDYLNYDYLDRGELAIFLKRREYFVTDADIVMLIRRLDINCDGVVTLDDFKEIFFPASKNSIHSMEKDCVSNSYFFNFRSREKDRTLRSPLRGSVGLKASLQSYTSPIRELNCKEDIKQNLSYFSKRNTRDQYQYSPISNQSFYSSTRFSDFTNTNDRIPFNPSNIDYESIITNYLIKLISLEDKLQAVKESFCLREFNLKQLFNIFDPYNKGYAILSDFHKGLDILNLYSTVLDLRLLFKRYDIHKAGKLSATHFTQMIAPIKNEYAKLLNNKFSTYSSIKHERPTEEFVSLIKLLIETEYEIETLRKSSTNHPYFILSDAFHVLKGDYGLQKYIIKEDINSFLKRHGVIVTDFQLEYVLERYDKNRDCRITIDEFMDEFLPLNYT